MSAVDVLAALKKEADYSGCLGPKAAEARTKRLMQVHAAVAELIEADKAYDEARKAATPDHSGHEIPDEAYFQLAAASDRRAAALARVGGGK